MKISFSSNLQIQKWTILFFSEVKILAFYSMKSRDELGRTSTQPTYFVPCRSTVASYNYTLTLREYDFTNFTSLVTNWESFGIMCGTLTFMDLSITQRAD